MIPSMKISIPQKSLRFIRIVPMILLVVVSAFCLNAQQYTKEQMEQYFRNFLTEKGYKIQQKPGDDIIIFYKDVPTVTGSYSLSIDPQNPQAFYLGRFVYVLKDDDDINLVKQYCQKVSSEYNDISVTVTKGTVLALAYASWTDPSKIPVLFFTMKMGISAIRMEFMKPSVQQKFKKSDTGSSSPSSSSGSTISSRSQGTHTVQEVEKMCINYLMEKGYNYRKTSPEGKSYYIQFKKPEEKHYLQSFVIYYDNPKNLELLRVLGSIPPDKTELLNRAKNIAYELTDEGKLEFAIDEGNGNEDVLFFVFAPVEWDPQNFKRNVARAMLALLFAERTFFKKLKQ